MDNLGRRLPLRDVCECEVLSGCGWNLIGDHNRVDNYTSKVYWRLVLKNVPHHLLSGIQAKFADVETLEITSSAIRSANAIGYSLEGVVDVVQTLEKRDFVKSETQHSPPKA